MCESCRLYVEGGRVLSDLYFINVCSIVFIIKCVLLQEFRHLDGGSCFSFSCDLMSSNPVSCRRGGRV